MKINFSNPKYLFNYFTQEGEFFLSLVYFLLWTIFNGRITFEIIVIGILISILLDIFIRKIVGFNLTFSGLIKFFKIFPDILFYASVLLFEIVKANISITRHVLASNIDVEPCLIKFNTSLKTEIARVVFANSITLTPGTITISLEGNELLIHTLNRELAKGLDTGESLFERILMRMERMLNA